jgi:hypothetical protein
MRPFMVTIHDATPAYARETASMIRDLGSLIGHRVAFGVVPDWDGRWPLAEYSDFCRMLQETSEELLLHGYCHRRRNGTGAATWLTGRSDEMNGFDREETRLIIDRGQRVFTDVFGKPSRGFLAPAWQRGRVRANIGSALGPEYILGFFSLESAAGRRVPLATSTWDCGRWSWLGHVGHGIGRLLRSLEGRVPSLAIHPRDLERGFRPQILALVHQLLEAGYEPVTPAGLLQAHDAEIAV